MTAPDLNEFKITLLGTKKVGSTKIYFDIFIEIMFAFLLQILKLLEFWKLLFRKKQ